MAHREKPELYPGLKFPDTSIYRGDLQRWSLVQRKPFGRSWMTNVYSTVDSWRVGAQPIALGSLSAAQRKLVRDAMDRSIRQGGTRDRDRGGPPP